MEEAKMENGQKCSCGQHCGCGHPCGCGHGRHLIKCLLGILLLAVVFALGVKLGEFKAEIRGYGDIPFGGYYGKIPPQRMLFYGSGAMPNIMYQTASATPMMTLPAGSK